MEIKDILSELITVSTNLLGEKGNPENFDLEDFKILSFLVARGFRSLAYQQ